MIDDKNEGVEEALSVIKEYRLLREDIDSLVELTTWPGKKSLMDEVDGRVKAALTRSYNKEVTPYVYSATANIKKRKSSAEDDYLNEYGEEGGSQAVSDDDDADNDKLENDTLIKPKKSTVSKAKSGSSAGSSRSTSSTSSKRGTSKKK